MEDEWSACRDGLEIALRRAMELLESGYEAAGFGSLLEVVGRSLDPLEPFARAEERFASLRRRKDVPARSRASNTAHDGEPWHT